MGKRDPISIDFSAEPVPALVEISAWQTIYSIFLAPVPAAATRTFFCLPNT
jgi:hypothetical protein